VSGAGQAHFPPSHDTPAGHARPQPPQFAGSALVSEHTSPQGVFIAGQSFATDCGSMIVVVQAA
jgi:hypothetical protein